MPQFMPREHPEAQARKLTCGQCQWFTVGYEGKSCKEYRLVEISTPACVEYQPKMVDFFAELCRDKYLQQIRERIKKNPKLIVDDTVIQEMWGFTLDSDLLNFTYGTTQSLEAATRALAKCISFRSRTSNLHTALIDIEHDLEALEKEAWLWMNSKYKVVRELKNEALRNSAFDRIFPELIKIRTNINKGVATAKIVDDTLARNESALRTIVDAASRLVFNKDRLVKV